MNTTFPRPADARRFHDCHRDFELLLGMVDGIAEAANTLYNSLDAYKWDRVDGEASDLRAQICGAAFFLAQRMVEGRRP